MDKGTLRSLWNWHLSVLNAVRRLTCSHEGCLRGRFLSSRSCSTEQEDLKTNVNRAAPGHLPGRAARRQIDCKRPRACVACSLPGLLECCGVFWCNLTHTRFPRDRHLVPCNRRARTNSLSSGFLPLPSSTANPLTQIDFFSNVQKQLRHQEAAFCLLAGRPHGPRS